MASQSLEEATVIPDVNNAAPLADRELVVSFENEGLTNGTRIQREKTTTGAPSLRLEHGGSGTEHECTILMTDPDLFVKNDPTDQVRVRTHGSYQESDN